MRFSKQKMEEYTSADYQAVYVTNNFHLLRAGVYAKRAGLKAQGLGSKTAFYFWANVFIRKFISFIVLYRKIHTLIISMVFLFLAASTLLLQLIS